MTEDGELSALKAENRQLRSLLRRIHKATKQFYVPRDVKPDDCPYNEILASYHRILHNLPKVQKLTEKRRKSMRQRWGNDLISLVDWEAYFKDASKKSFLFGRNDREWIADFDFLLREQTITFMQEGKYG